MPVLRRFRLRNADAPAGVLAEVSGPAGHGQADQLGGDPVIEIVRVHDQVMVRRVSDVDLQVLPHVAFPGPVGFSEPAERLRRGKAIAVLKVFLAAGDRTDQADMKGVGEIGGHEISAPSHDDGPTHAAELADRDGGVLEQRPLRGVELEHLFDCADERRLDVLRHVLPDGWREFVIFEDAGDEFLVEVGPALAGGRLVNAQEFGQERNDAISPGTGLSGHGDGGDQSRSRFRRWSLSLEKPTQVRLHLSKRVGFQVHDEFMLTGRFVRVLRLICRTFRMGWQGQNLRNASQRAKCVFRGIRQSRIMSRSGIMTAAVFVLGAGLVPAQEEQQPDREERVFEAEHFWRNECASCHGQQGEGGRPSPLALLRWQC